MKPHGDESGRLTFVDGYSPRKKGGSYAAFARWRQTSNFRWVEEATVSNSVGRNEGFARFSRSLTLGEWGRLGAMAAMIVAMHVVAWGTFIIVILPQHFRYNGLGVGFGVAVTAYTLGARHAFDADHISAIDNVTRKLMSDGQRPLASGFFFALGHSSVIMTVGVGLSIAARAVFSTVVDPHATLSNIAGVVGTAVSGTFLYVIAALNIFVLLGIARVYRDMRHGTFDEAELEHQLQMRGFMYRFFGRFTRAISHSWQMFPVGAMFAFGFDTATEVLLLAATAAAATQGLPWYAVICLPLLFSSGVTLFDTLDGILYEFRLRLGVRESRAKDLLQPGHHRAIDSGGVRNRHDRTRGSGFF